MSMIRPRPMPSLADHLNRTKKKKQPKPMRRVSKKREKQNCQYSKDRLVFLAEHPRCACGCGGRSVEIHHAAGREAWLLNEQKHWKAMTRECHVRVQDDKEWAVSKGLRYEVTRQ